MERHVTHLPYTWNQRNKKDNERFIDSKTTRAVVVRGKAGKGIKRQKPLVTEYRSNGEESILPDVQSRIYHQERTLIQENHAV